MKNIWYVGGVIVGILGLLIYYHSNKPVNVIIISLETTRADHLSCYGYTRKTSPNLDQLAKEGVLFEQMFAQRGQTWPSLASIMTSTYPVVHQVRKNGHFLPQNILTIAEIFKQKKYQTVAFLTNAKNVQWKGFDLIKTAPGEFQRDELMTDEAIRWIENHHSKPFYLWLHLWQPHKPYQPPPPYNQIFNPNYDGIIDGRSEQTDDLVLSKKLISPEDLNQIVSLYDGSILYADYQIGKLLDQLNELELKENTVICFIADHGEDLYEHHQYFYHSASVYDSSLHIPCIIRFPGNAWKNIKYSPIVESIDLMPTLLGFLDWKIPHDFLGENLYPFNRQQNSKNYAISEYRDQILTIRTKDYRYIYNPNEHHPIEIEGATEISYPIQKEELYAHPQDYSEQNNLILTHSVVINKLSKRLFNWPFFELWNKGEIAQNQAVPEHIQKHLKSLGYV